jgi:hypothetical protein
MGIRNQIMERSKKEGENILNQLLIYIQLLLVLYNRLHILHMTLAI